MYFKRMINDFRKNGGKVYPMEEECINQILGIYGYLPKAYIEFLKTMGNGTGDRFLSGYSCFSKEIFNLKDWAMEILYENENTELLNKSDYVFMMMQGIVFWYFDLNDGDDPPVYEYDEYGSVNGQIVCNHFSIFINNLYHTLEKR